MMVQVMNIKSCQGKASVLYIPLHALQIVLKFACIAIMFDHISKRLNILGFDQTFYRTAVNCNLRLSITTTVHLVL